MDSATAFLKRLWATNAVLTGVGLLMLPCLLLALVGLVLDGRTIGGAPAWLKPAKFCASIAIFCLTTAWVLTKLSVRPRVGLWLGRIVGVALFVEIVLIAMQAARGTSSHFNIATPFDAFVFSTMGLTILVLWVCQLGLTALAFREPFAERDLGWAIRLGMLVTLLGASSGALMTQPTADQLARARDGMPLAGAHTVGAPDGGPGIPGVGWSREHGDLRVPHFVGLHANQFLLAALWLARRSRAASERSRVLLVFAVAGAIVGLFAIALWQALSGEPLLGPGRAVAFAAAAWAVALFVSFGAWVVSARRAAASARPPAAEGMVR